MARQEKRVARKDYPRDGIKKGDTYYYTKLKLQRGGIEKRSLKPFKPSQLTTSSFKIAFLSAGESFDEAMAGDDYGSLPQALTDAAEAIRDAGQEARVALLKALGHVVEGDTGQMLEARADGCDSKADELDGLAGDAQDLLDNEPNESDFKVPEGEDEGDEAVNDDGLTFDEAMEAYNESMADLKSQAEDILNDMPEG
jgi:hypothetical protein